MVSLADVLTQNAEVLSLLPTNRIKCSMTGHEMPPNVDVVTSHLKGKKFQKAQEWYTHDYTQYLPLIIEHRSDKTKLFCTLTRLQLNKIPAEIKKHVKGKKFLRLQAVMQAKADKADSAKALRQKERLEAEKAGVWIPPDNILGLDDDESASNNEDIDDDSDVAMDEGSDNDDNDWIITSEKLSHMKAAGSMHEEVEVESKSRAPARNQGKLRNGINDHGKRIKKSVSQTEIQRESTTKKKKRS